MRRSWRAEEGLRALASGWARWRWMTARQQIGLLVRSESRRLWQVDAGRDAAGGLEAELAAIDRGGRDGGAAYPEITALQGAYEAGSSEWAAGEVVAERCRCAERRRRSKPRRRVLSGTAEWLTARSDQPGGAAGDGAAIVAEGRRWPRKMLRALRSAGSCGGRLSGCRRSRSRCRSCSGIELLSACLR